MKRTIFTACGAACVVGLIGTVGACDIGTINFGQTVLQLGGFGAGLLLCKLCANYSMERRGLPRSRNIRISIRQHARVRN